MKYLMIKMNTLYMEHEKISVSQFFNFNFLKHVKEVHLRQINL